MSSPFELNKQTLEKLLNEGALDLIMLRDVTEKIEDMLEESRWKRRKQCPPYIITGSYAASLAGAINEYNDIDIFCDKSNAFLPRGGKIELIVKERWRDVFHKDVKGEDIYLFASLIIHLFDLDCCRFVCINTNGGEKGGRWFLYTCSAG
jgi:hypothetical protein